MANELDYTNFDFDKIVVQLQDRLKDKDAWQDIYRSSTGEMLIEFLAYVLNLGLFYTERRAEESYLLTARNISSVKNLVSLLNYIPKRKTSAIGNLTFTIPVALDKVVFIPKYTECSSADGRTFLTNVDSAIEKGQTEIIISSIQGKAATKEIVADGNQDQEHTIDSTDVENSPDVNNPTLRVVVDSIVWESVESFIRSEPTSQHYRVINEPDGRTTIAFGDGVNGEIPPSGQDIVISYLVSEGLDGNVTFPDVITTIVSTIFDEESAVVEISVTNAGSFLGGDDAEDIEEIRFEAPRLFKTGDRAVSRTDFIAILENLAGVANVNTWGENEEALEAGVPADFTMLNKVRLSILLQDFIFPDQDFKDFVVATLVERSMQTVKYEFVDPTILDVIPVLFVRVTAGNSLSQAQADISEVLNAQFELGVTTKIGTIIKHSNILAALDSLDNVAYITMILEIKKELELTAPLTWDVTLGATDIKPETTRLFLDDVFTVIDVDDGFGTTGTFTVAGVLTGTIDYATGDVSIAIDSGFGSPPTAVHARYQQDADGNIRTQLRQICRLDVIDVQGISIE